MYGFAQQIDRSLGTNSGIPLEFTYPKGMLLLPESYRDPIGTIGAANAAQNVKSLLLRGNTVNARRKRLDLWVLFSISGTSITITLSLRGVTLFTSSCSAGIGYRFPISLEYIDPTHAHMKAGFLESNSATPLSPTNIVNQAGFSWVQDQQLTIAQTAFTATFMTVYAMEMRVGN